ncbi:hypothetical protein OSB04_024093 [Centaurea solstitialis]|uniref:Retrovirus-related Pol polyprotein from transposon TNT 1-94 n=1 Tax=Centaurea solstitialis TaxID=347529 RepID=A0AA38WDJ5_9ASTR|nr:hypothetical protein OSB04_024093 [Centaurea solstitialis]
MIGSLMYLTASRPDIMFSTCLCARYQSKPKDSHLKAVKRIFRYLKSTVNLSLWYPKGSGYELTDKLVSWASKKQHCVSLSTAEAEYVAAASCCSQIIWMRTQLRDYGFKFDKIPIYCDSKSVIAISCNPVQHTKTKHIDIRYHFIKDHVEKGTIELYFVNTEFQLADLFTKALDEKRFNFLITKLGGVNEKHKNKKRLCVVETFCRWIGARQLQLNQRVGVQHGRVGRALVLARDGPRMWGPMTPLGYTWDRLWLYVQKGVRRGVAARSSLKLYEIWRRRGVFQGVTYVGKIVPQTTYNCNGEEKNHTKGLVGLDDGEIKENEDYSLDKKQTLEKYRVKIEDLKVVSG